MSHRQQVTRRRVLQAGAAAVAVPFVFRPWECHAAEVSAELRIGAVGVGNQGWDDLQAVASAPGARIVALCDVDDRYLSTAHGHHDAARSFIDYRKMLDECEQELDAVLISTPDHMHAAIAIDAMMRGKHVYVQKPLAHNLAEVRQMATVAADRRVVTQMGTQIHSHSAYRSAAKLLRDGAIGKVREAHCWTSSTWIGRFPALAQKPTEPPAGFEWQLWQGVAPERPYVAGRYHPEKWRRWRNYGTGILGDMGCHLLDPLFSGLDLRPPLQVISHGPAHSAETYELNADVAFTFAPTSYTEKTFSIRWTNGSVQPHAERARLPSGVSLPGSGSFVVGERGVMVLPHWEPPRFYRDGALLEIAYEPQPSIDHYHQWVAACRGEGAATTPFSYSAPLAETVLVGTLAGNFPGRVLHWNSQELQFDYQAATALVHREYRPEWRPVGM